MMGTPPGKSELGPTQLILLGLCVSMVSFAGFRIASGVQPGAPGTMYGDRVAVASVVPASVQSLFAPRLSPADPHHPRTAAIGIVSPEPIPAPGEISTPAGANGWENSTLASVPSFREVSHRFATGETFSEVLATYGVSPDRADAWIKAANRVYNLGRVFAGQRLDMTVDVAAFDLVSLEMEVDAETNLVARRKEGVVVATREPLELGRQLRVVQGEIRQSFYSSAARLGVPDEIISEVADVLGWDLDFNTEIHGGATFSIAFEELSKPGVESAGRPGRLLAVSLENRGKTHEGFFFQAPGEKSGSYYARNGQSLGRDFLRYPVSFVRISSNFSHARLHPILKRARPHYGVDFAAPTGTPVRAVAAGKVEMASWHGGKGRYVEIRHDSVYESGYAHLSRIAPGVRPGAAVRKGQVIGYVGSTGLATGPHLHFEMFKDGKYINPLNTSMPLARPLSTESQRRFRDSVTKIDAAYAAAERAGGTLAIASSSSSEVRASRVN